MIKDFEQRVANLLRLRAKHELIVLEEGQKIQAYYIKEPGTRLESTLVVFAPEGIALMGDFTPEHHGSVSALGYGLGWFAKPLDPCYLCSKFLDSMKWTREVAVEQLRDPSSYWREERSPGILEQLDELAIYVDSGDYGPEMIYDTLNDLGFETSDHLPGYGYDPNEATRLVAIQRKFAQLWAARKR